MSYLFAFLIPLFCSTPPIGPGPADCCPPNSGCCIVCPECPPSCCGG